MKKLMMTLALAALTAGAVNAQEKQHKTPAERAKAQTERMSKELGLDAAQATKVEAINAKYAEKLQALRAERKAEREAGKDPEHNGEGKALKEARYTELATVLNAEQMEKCKAMEEKQLEQRKEHMKEKQQLQKSDGK